jgi:hypothetical protein
VEEEDLEGTGRICSEIVGKEGSGCEDILSVGICGISGTANGIRVVCRGREADFGRGGGLEFLTERPADLCDGRSRFLNLGGEPIINPPGKEDFAEKGRPEQRS